MRATYTDASIAIQQRLELLKERSKFFLKDGAVLSVWYKCYTARARAVRD